MLIVRGLLVFLLLVTALFLILIVMVQRGKGGGLAGALGGMGGQSAFGTKAGDLFTKITIGVAAFWIVLCTITVKVLGVSASADVFEVGTGTEAKPPISAPANTDGAAGPTSGEATKSPSGSGSAPAAPAGGAAAPAGGASAPAEKPPAPAPAKK